MGVFSEANLYGMTIRESATDGSDFANAPADYRRLFLGEDGNLHVKDSAGTVTDIGGAGGDITTDAAWAAKGDLIVATGNNAASVLTAGSNSLFLAALSSEATGLLWGYPPGFLFDHAQVVSQVTVSGTSEGGETTVITGNAVTYDGATDVIIEFHAPRVDVTPSAAGRGAIFTLYDGAAVLGRIALFIPTFVSTVNSIMPVTGRYRLRPSAGAHTYAVKCYKSNASDTVYIKAEEGGSGKSFPAFLRITKA